MRTHVDKFPLCEFFSFWCVGGHQKPINLKKETRVLLEDHIENTFASMSNRKEFGCGANLRPTQAASKLCNLTFGVDCM
ncbi:hypothetical protein L596_002526 [Steinernema carpocapsae]|uniref:Uncharacterized protein n=1 Tax=Steinernema carpocapsae TaxID=34508 RepID=A0A4U8USC3_STECR|nr:hypothetical protein L596_002526 [Steinernema carpocapsae]